MGTSLYPKLHKVIFVETRVKMALLHKFMETYPLTLIVNSEGKKHRGRRDETRIGVREGRVSERTQTESQKRVLFV